MAVQIYALLQRGRNVQINPPHFLQVYAEEEMEHIDTQSLVHFQDATEPEFSIVKS
jgi:hypothetical protein